MTLTERYLKAVAAQLPKASREDIVAELRDAIQTRMEAREEELGRPLGEADEEAVLREFGHPLSVAGRYGSGPQHVVGPELYPWWMFGVKVGLIALACITAISAAIRLLIGDVDAGQAISQGFNSLISGGITIVGLATIAGFFIERQKTRPAFLREWRVRDLGLFELGGFDAETVSRHMSGAVESGRGQSRGKSRQQLSPTARALGSAAAWTVLLLWWIGFLPLSDLRPEDFSAVAGGVDYGVMIGQILDILHWPIAIYAACRVLVDLIRASNSGQVRLMAVGDLVVGAADVALFGWLWIASPLSPVIRVDSVEAFFGRLWDSSNDGWWTVANILMVCVAFGFIQALVKIFGALWRLTTGRPLPFSRWEHDAEVKGQATRAV